MECLGRYTFFVMTPSAAFREALSLASRPLENTAPEAKKARKSQNQEPANTSESRHVKKMRKQRPRQQRRSKQPLATKRLANKRWSAVSRLRRITIRRPPLAVRRACLRRRAFYASPCQATAPSLERFTHRAHSAGPLRPEVELTPSKVRKSNPCFIDVRCFFKTIWGSKMEAKMKSKSCLGAFQDALGAGLPLEAILASIFDLFLHPPNH